MPMCRSTFQTLRRRLLQRVAAAPSDKTQQLQPLRPSQCPPPSDAGVLTMRQTRDDDAFVGFHAIPDPERKAPHRRATMLARAADDLILERVLTDAGERVAHLLDEAVAKAGLA